MKMANNLSMASIYASLLLLLLASFVQFLVADFIVTDYGADATGNTDSTTAMVDTWRGACNSNRRERVVVPKGTYLVKGQVIFSGEDCPSPPYEFRLSGTLVAPEDITAFTDSDVGWITFRHLTGFLLSGGSPNGSLFDGRGASAWSNGICTHEQNRCTSLSLHYLTKSMVRNINSLDPKMFHISVHGCVEIYLSGITITAPKGSNNTDGIHVSKSMAVDIKHSSIGTGDDCISLGEGCQGVSVMGVKCGPGHGISIGSLGDTQGESPVRDIIIADCNLMGTENGVRVKTKLGSRVVNSVTNVVFQNINMVDVQNPIIVVQDYCDHECLGQAPSLVQIDEISFINIGGTSATLDAITLKFSSEVPCQHLTFGNINLSYQGGLARTFCENAKQPDFIYGSMQNPPIVCSP